ncbi:MAG: glycosyltransferase [Bacteroidota bacterium]
MNASPSSAPRCVLLGPAYPYRGGIAHFTDTLAQRLRAHGQPTTIITFRRQYPAWLFPGQTQYEEGPPPAGAVPRHRVIDVLNPLTWWYAAQTVLREAPRRLVIAYWMPFFAPAFAAIAWLVRRRGVRVTALVHNALPHEARPGDRWLTRLFLRQCDAAITLSAAVAADVRRLHPTLPVTERMHPVYDHFGETVPKHEARVALGLDTAAPTLLFFGFVRRYKGLDVLLEALPYVAERLPDVRLVVAGEFYEDERIYRAQVERLGLGARVQMHDHYIPEEAVRLYFSAADLVVQPYRSATQSGVAQIAFHFGRPLVVTDVGGLAEIVPHEEAGFVVPPEAPEALAGAIARFYTEAWAERLTSGAERQAQRFGWGPVVQAVRDA